MSDFEKGIKQISKVFLLEYQADDMDFSVEFIGKSEQDCRNLLLSWLKGETTVRIRKMDDNVNILENEVSNQEDLGNIPENLVETVATSPSVVKKSARGAHFIGSTWVLRHSTKEKFRVPSKEVDDYLAKGFVKGGPRTKFI